MEKTTTLVEEKTEILDAEPSQFLAAEIEAAKKMAADTGLEYIPFEALKVDPELYQGIPVDLLVRYQFVPLEERDGCLVIAVEDPLNVVELDELESLLARPLMYAVTTATAIQDVLKKKESSQRILEKETEGLRTIDAVEEIDEHEISIDQADTEASPIIRLLNLTIFNALQRRASDVHIETRERNVHIKYRIDGVLYPAMEPLDFSYHSAIISRIKVMSELDIAEKRIPQDGRFKLRYQSRTIDFRVSIMPCIYGEDSVIRILDKESTNESFKELNLGVLGFDGDIYDRVKRAINQPYGMFLVTGPTGSGKTTTLYAALSEIRNEEDKIVTVEDPVEYQLDGITQIPVNEKKGLTFSRGLRSILRHDPDKIMVGEIRDSETAEIAVQSALTGHLVFTTIHANNVIDVIGRFLNMGVEPYNFVGALNCILAQRLVRVICPRCKVKVNYDNDFFREHYLDPDKYRKHQFYVGEGCIDCHGTGFHGRTSIHELLDLDDEIREAILERKPGSEVRRIAQGKGMRSLRHSAIDVAISGVTSLPEVNKVSFVEDVL